MTIRTDRQFLKVQLLETERLQQLTADHPVMSHALAVRQQELNEQIRALPLGKQEPRADLFLSDEPVTGLLTETAPRVVQNLKVFLEVIAKGKAGLRLESGDLRSEMTPLQASRAFERVSATQSVDESVTLTGTLKGVLLDSWEFNFTALDGEPIAGKIDPELSEDQVIEFNAQHFNRGCIATLLKTTVSFKNGRNRVTYQLQQVDPPAAP